MSMMKLRALTAAMGLVALPAPLPAQSVAASGERVLSDPTFLPLQGQFEGESGYQHQSSDLTESTGLRRREAIDTLTQQFEYGVIDDVTLVAKAEYTWTHYDVSSSGERYSLTADGFADPSFAVIWRALDQRHRQPLDLDLSVSYAPSVIGAAAAGRSRTGTTASGADVLSLRGALGWESRSLTVQAYFEGSRIGSATVAETSGQEDIQSRWEPKIGAVTQVWFTPRLSVRLEGAYEFQSTVNEFATAGGAPSVHRFGDEATVGAEVNYQIIVNRLVGAIEYSHVFYGTTDIDYPLAAATDVSEQHSVDGVAVVLRYAFW